MLKSGAGPESLSLFSPDLAVGHPQGESVGIFPYILGVTGKTGSDIEEQLSICWKSLLCCSAQFYLCIFISERKRRKKITGIENSFSTLNSEFVQNIECFVHDS